MKYLGLLHCSQRREVFAEWQELQAMIRIRYAGGLMSPGFTAKRSQIIISKIFK